jgi:hypothetical protein
MLLVRQTCRWAQPVQTDQRPARSRTLFQAEASRRCHQRGPKIRLLFVAVPTYRPRRYHPIFSASLNQQSHNWSPRVASPQRPHHNIRVLRAIVRNREPKDAALLRAEQVAIKPKAAGSIFCCWPLRSRPPRHATPTVKTARPNFSQLRHLP